MIHWKQIQTAIPSTDLTLLTHRACPVCRNDTSTLLVLFENFQFFSDADTNKQVDITQRQCKKCGTIYMNPCYSSIGFDILFKEARMSYGHSTIRPGEQRDWLDKYNLLQNGYSVLDIGCGSGEFLSSLPDGLQKYGVDIDLDSIKIAQGKYPQIEFKCSDFNKLEYEEKINIITMFHVLEHLPSPLETLKRLHHISHKETHIIIEVPIIENGLTNDINGFFSVQHLTHFSRVSLKNILRKSGWDILEWMEQETYNGCRVLAKKSEPTLQLETSKIERQNVYNYLQFWYKSLCAVEKKIQNIETDQCIIWGGGLHLEFLYQTTSLFTKPIEFIIVDSDKEKQNTTWRGIHIYPPSIIKHIKNIPSLIISSYGGQESIYNACIDLGAGKDSIIKLYDYIKVY